MPTRETPPRTAPLLPPAAPGTLLVFARDLPPSVAGWWRRCRSFTGTTRRSRQRRCPPGSSPRGCWWVHEAARRCSPLSQLTPCSEVRTSYVVRLQTSGSARRAPPARLPDAAIMMRPRRPGRHLQPAGRAAQGRPAAHGGADGAVLYLRGCRHDDTVHVREAGRGGEQSLAWWRRAGCEGRTAPVCAASPALCTRHLPHPACGLLRRTAVTTRACSGGGSACSRRGGTATPTITDVPATVTAAGRAAACSGHSSSKSVTAAARRVAGLQLWLRPIMWGQAVKL